jgi:hypothetical protein
MRYTIEQLPPHLRAQAEAQMSTPRPTPETDIKPSKKPAKRKKINRGQMSKTEERFAREFHLLGLYYEPLSLRLPGGGRYTPDFASIDRDQRITLYEVKGSYRLHSHGRAHLAFRVAAATYSELFTFKWFQLVEKVFVEKNLSIIDSKPAKHELFTTLFTSYSQSYSQ